MNKFSILRIDNSIDFFFEQHLTLNIFSYNYWSEQYSYILFYMLVSFFLCSLLFILAFFLSPKEINFEKTSPYECGFEPFGDGHSIFNIQFFVVGILFMIFDLELAYLFPWTVNLGNINFLSFFVMLVFLILLTFGLVYE